MRTLISIDVGSGVNESGVGFVTITATDDSRTMMVGQMPTETTRELAMNFLAAAEASETDAIVYRLLRDKFGLELPAIGGFITDMRNAREGND